MKSVKNIVLISLSTTILAACTIPGSALKVSDKNVVMQNDSHVSIDELVDIYPITPLLIQRLQKPTVYESSNPALMQSLRNYRYRVQAGDMIQVLVWDHPQLMQPFGTVSSSQTSGVTVRSNGQIHYPYVGAVNVAGKTVDEIQAILTKRLSAYFKHPKLEVSVVQYRSQRASITGAVKNSSQLPITDVPLTLSEAVSRAGGYNDNADIQHIKVTRNGQSMTVSLYDLMQHGDVNQNFLVQDGDLIYIPTNEGRKVHIMGEVHKQTTLRLDPTGMSLTDALGEAGGLNNHMANAKGVFVIRAENGMPNNKIGKIYQLDLSDASAHVLGTQFQLQPNDVIYVTAAPVARWNRVLSNVFPSVSSVLAVANTAGTF